MYFLYRNENEIHPEELDFFGHLIEQKIEPLFIDDLDTYGVTDLEYKLSQVVTSNNTANISELLNITDVGFEISDNAESEVILREGAIIKKIKLNKKEYYIERHSVINNTFEKLYFYDGELVTITIIFSGKKQVFFFNKEKAIWKQENTVLKKPKSVEGMIFLDNDKFLKFNDRAELLQMELDLYANLTSKKIVTTSIEVFKILSKKTVIPFFVYNKENEKELYSKNFLNSLPVIIFTNYFSFIKARGIVPKNENIFYLTEKKADLSITSEKICFILSEKSIQSDMMKAVIHLKQNYIEMNKIFIHDDASSHARNLIEQLKMYFDIQFLSSDDLSAMENVAYVNLSNNIIANMDKIYMYSSGNEMYQKLSNPYKIELSTYDNFVFEKFQQVFLHTEYILDTKNLELTIDNAILKFNSAAISKAILTRFTKVSGQIISIEAELDMNSIVDPENVIVKFVLVHKSSQREYHIDKTSVQIISKNKHIYCQTNLDFENLDFMKGTFELAIRLYSSNYNDIKRLGYYRLNTVELNKNEFPLYVNSRKIEVTQTQKNNVVFKVSAYLFD